MAQSSKLIVWSPQAGPQKALIDCPYPLIGYGGARGGGKTDGILGKFGIKAQAYGHHYNAIFFRKELPQADDLVERAKEIYLPLGAKYNDQKKQFVFRNLARVRFRPLANDADAEKYQGQNLTDAAVEEAGNYASPSPILKLFGALRSSAGFPVQLVLTFNPGGPGHHWLKEKFVKPAPLGFKRLKWLLDNGKEVDYTFIPSKVTDNKILTTKDPGYMDRLYMSGNPELVRAWVNGDWEIHAGAYFPEFSTQHIIKPFSIPKHWPKYVGFDWGFFSPFCAVWGAVSSGKDDNGKEVPYPQGSMVIYRELWGKGVAYAEVGRRIAELTRDENPLSVADPSIFAHDGGLSIEDEIWAGMKMGTMGRFRPGNNDRLSGWAQIRTRLTSKMIYFFDTCPYLIDTIPALAIDPRNAEDADTTGEDHGADALRYLCKERLLTPTLEVKSEPVRHGHVRVQDFINQSRRDAKRTRI